MDNIINTHINAKTLLKTVAVISSIALVLSITLTNAYAVPPERIESCQKDETAAGDLWQCCWTETDPADPEKIEIYLCQHCFISDGKVECNPPEPDPTPIPPTTREDISPGDTEILEQTPTTNNPSIKSDNSVFPNEDSNVLYESQPSTNPTFNSNKGTIIEENLAQDQPMQFSSNDEQSQESEELTETDNVDTASNVQENDDSSTSETTASFGKKGNSQTSPVPPECPKQGPIPPDCTMKPKF